MTTSKNLIGKRALAKGLFTAAVAATVLGALPSTASADIPGPAVRHRKLLVRERFELTPLFESSINADFRHVVGGGI